jgi:hypothetical protein
MRRAALILFILIASAAQALTYRVQMRDGQSADAAKATLRARLIDGDADPIERRISIPSQGTIELADGTWEIRLEADDVWAAPVYAHSDERIAFDAIPAARLQAEIANTDVAIAEIPIQLTQSDAQSPDRFRADIICPMIERAIRCTVPAGTYDLRLAPKGFMPQFRWNVRFVAGAAMKLEPISLLRGASIIGTVVRNGRGAIPADTRITLTASDADHPRSSSLQTPPNAKGFFEFTSVPPGQYRITAAAKSLTSDSREIRVVADRTAELNAPLVLDTPKRVRATIAPLLDPDGKPWLIELARKHPSGRYDTIGSGSVDSSGVWEQKSLPDGEYLLTITRRDHSGQWSSQKFTVTGVDVDLPIAVPMIHAEGTIAFGDQPIAARLHFGGEYGAVRQMLVADDEGSFSGMLPMRENSDRWDVFVESTSPPTRTTLAAVEPHADAEGRLHFELRIPRTIVLGTVTNVDGKPAPNALVNLTSLKTTKLQQMSTGPDGSFQFSGLQPGRYRATAEEFLAASDAVELEVTENDSPTLQLVLKKIQQLKGRVVNGALPVIGARISAISRNTPPPLEQLTASSNETGAFTLLVPSETNTIDVLIVPPGFAAMMGRMPVKTDLLMQVSVDQHGGSLIADIPPDPAVHLGHNGASLWLNFIAGASGGAIRDEDGRRRITIPALQAGPYELCLRERCTSGSLPPHGTLTLTLK